MAVTIAKLAVSLSANTASFTTGMDQAAKRTADFVNGSARASTASTGLAASLKELDSSTKGIEKLLKGGAAFGIFTFAANALNKALDETSKVMEKVHAGELSVQEGAEEIAISFAKAIPVVGGFFDAGLRIGNMISGIDEMKARIAKLDKQHQDASEKMSKDTAAYQGAVSQATSATEQLNREIQRFGKSGEALKTLDANLDFEDAQKQIQGLIDVLNALPPKPFKGERENLAALIGDMMAAARVARDMKIDAARQETLFPAADRESVRKTIESLRAQVDAVAMGADAYQLYTAQVKGATDAELELIRSLQSSRDRLNEVKAAQASLESFAASVIDQTRTPMEKHEAQMDRLSEALNAGILKWDDYARAVRAANVSLAKSQDMGPNTASVAAREFRFTAGVPNSNRTDPLEAIERLNKQQLDEAKKNNERLRMINDKLRDNARSDEPVVFEIGPA